MTNRPAAGGVGEIARRDGVDGCARGLDQNVGFLSSFSTSLGLDFRGRERRRDGGGDGKSVVHGSAGTVYFFFAASVSRDLS